MERRERSRFNAQIYEEACEWFIECRAGELDEGARSVLDQWLRKSPEHVSAYLEVAAIWNEGPSLDPKSNWDLDTLISQAAHDSDNVVPWPSAALAEMAAPAGDRAPHSGRSTASQPDSFKELPFPHTSSEELSRSHGPSASPIESTSQFFAIVRSPDVRAHTAARWRLGIAASIATASIVATLSWLTVFSAPTYATAIGEQRSIQLDDGSAVELNSRSKLVIHFSKYERDVKLIEGQALFRVAKDASRPFVVTSGDTKVRTVGTQFDVYKKDTGTIVTVVEGKIAILTDHPVSDRLSPASASSAQIPSAPPPGSQVASILLSAGEQLTVMPKEVRMTQHANVIGATAWTEHEIVFEGASLADVAEEFNRYNQKQLVIDGSGLDSFHMSGVFSSTDPESLIQFLRERLGLRIVKTPTEIRIEKNIS